MNRAERIHALLAKELSPVEIEITDDSARHAGHAGAAPGGETHYRLMIASAAFAGLSKVQRHRMIYALLAEELETGLHALNIDARVPGEKG